MNLFMILKAFITGGIICTIGQILLDKTKLTSARILVLFVTIGCILGGLGIYEPLINFAGCGATVPLTGFGYCLAEGVKSAVDQYGFIGIFIGGLEATSGGIAAAILFSIVMSVFFKGKPENL
jgi:stage V sporulation protein AE